MILNGSQDDDAVVVLFIPNPQSRNIFSA